MKEVITILLEVIDDLKAERKLIEIHLKYQSNMLDEEGHPLPEWQAYFDELDALDVPEHELLGPKGFDIG